MKIRGKIGGFLSDKYLLFRIWVPNTQNFKSAPTKEERS